MCRITIANAGGPHICAFLDMLAYAEIGPLLLAISDDGYNVLVGSTPRVPKFFSSYAKHPNVYNAALNSTAAGRYQFIHPTWMGLVARLGLPDFSPLSQDVACIELLRQGGAIPHIEQGSITNAVEIARAINLEGHEWASLPSSDAGQPQRAMADLLRAYGAALARYETLADAL